MDQRQRYGQLETDGAPVRCPHRHIQDIPTISNNSKTNTLSTSHSEPILRHNSRNSSPTEQIAQNLSNLSISAEVPQVLDAETLVVNILEYMDRLYQQNQDGDTNLHLAIINEETAAISEIIENTYAQAYLDIKNNLGQTSLHIAIATDQPDIARTLLACGADPSIQDNLGRTALHYACEKGDMTAVEILTLPLKKYEISMADGLKYKVQREQRQCHEIRNCDGAPCTHLAARKGRTDIVEHLVNKCGHDINSQEYKSGKTILHVATESENIQLAQYLLNHQDTDTSIQDYSGHNALILAHYHPSILKLVLSRYPKHQESLQTAFYRMVEAEDDDFDPPPIMNGY